MDAEQRRYGNNNRKQTTKHKNATGPPKEPSDMSTFDKLILYLTKTNPEYSVSHFTEALYQVRRERQTLARLSLSQIEEGVLSIVKQKYSTNKNKSSDFQNDDILVDDDAQQSVAAALWNTFRRYREREELLKNADSSSGEMGINEDQCPICLENLNSKKTESFPCNHTFHRDCLEEWFKVERTCPLCRKMVLFADEYPALT